MKKRRITSLILAIVTVLAIIPYTAFSVSASNSKYNSVSGNWQYTVKDDGTIQIEYYSGSATSVTIPAKIGSKAVTSLGSSVFYENSKITSVSVPESVKKIGSNVFAYCTSLRTINLPSTLTSIGSDAFYKTAFYNDLSNWTGKLLYLGNYLVAAKNGSYSEGYLENASVKNGTVLIAGNVFSYFSKLKSISLPSTLKYIGDYAFSSCDVLTSLKIPSSVVCIGNYAFRNDIFTNITIPESATQLGNGIFSNCKKLTSVQLPSNLKTIPESTFSDCSALKTFSVPTKVTFIDFEAFSGCTSLSAITLPSTLTKIGGFAFQKCTSLKTAVLPDSVTDIGTGAFEDCTSLSSINIPFKVDTLYSYTFYNCTSLKSLKIPAGVTYISDYSYGYGGYTDDAHLTRSKKAISGCVITGYSGSKAQKYASENKIKFTKLVCSSHAYTNIVEKASFTNSGTVKKVCKKCGYIHSTTYLDRVDENVLKKTALAYTGKVVKPTASVKSVYGDKALSSSSYTLSCPDSVKIGTYKATVKLKGNYTGSVTVTYTIVPPATSSLKVSTTDYKSAKISWSKVSSANGYKLYRGLKNTASSYKCIKTISGNSTVSYKDTDLTPGKTYYYKIVPYYKSGSTLYNGFSKVFTFKNIPGSTSFSSVKTSGSKKIALSWKKVSYITGYQIQYSTSSAFKNAKSVSVSSKYTSKTLSGLSSGKKYYVRVRAYKTISSKSYYSSWSSSKSIKTK